MQWKFFYKLAVVALCVVLGGCQSAPPAVSEAQPPAATQTQKNSLVGIWVSYLELDAALRGADKQAAAAYLDGVMDACVQSGVNTVFFHVRAHGDAYYRSAVFPAADSVAALLAADFDPLQYALEAAHSRGLALHAWINPYRIGGSREAAVCDDVFLQGEQWYYIPTSQTVQRCILDGVRELVRDYPIDGVQYDDYFYPADISDKPLDFEKPAGSVPIATWRWAAVCALVSATCSAVHTRPGCLFGISPAGNLSRSRDRLYADVERWLTVDGYIDYLCPQLYTGFDNEALPFTAAADSFAAIPRAPGVRLYAGLAVYKTGEPDTFAGSGSAEWQTGGDVLARQAAYLEKAGYDGLALFRYAHWVGEGGAVRTAEIAALQTWLQTHGRTKDGG